MGYGDIDSAVSRSQFLKYAEDLAAIYGLERQHRTELKQAYEGLADLVHAMGDGAFIANAERNIVEINNMACTLLETGRARALGMPTLTLLNALPTRNASGLTPSLQAILQGEEQTITTDSGKCIRITPTLMKNGWLLCLLRDVTEEKRIQHLKQDFLGLLSHELRTPLTGILGFAELLLTRAASFETDDADAIRNIHDSGMRMFKIVDELLKFATLQHERHEMRREPLQLALLMYGIFEQMGREASARNISLYLDHDAAHPAIINGNSAMLREMFKNVIHNTIIFGKKDGNTVVRILPPANNTIIIKIEDDGIGIPDNLLKKVFDSFFQVEGTLSRRHQGLGLGLSIAQLIARIHGGTISLASELDNGTTCTISLPLVIHSAPSSSKEVNA
ncbi:MAG: ATP-binding protein [Halodesulfovibrio sp.]